MKEYVSSRPIDEVVTQVCKLIKWERGTSNNRLSHPLEYIVWLFFLKCLEYQELQTVPAEHEAINPSGSFKDIIDSWSTWKADVLKTDAQDQVTNLLYRNLFPQLQAKFDLDTNIMRVYPDITAFKQLLTLIDSMDLTRCPEKDYIAYLYSKLLDTLAKGDKTKSYKKTGIFSTPLWLV